MNGSFSFQKTGFFENAYPRGKEEFMNIWISILFIAGTVLTITEVAVSMYGNGKQARIAAEKELQHIRFTYGKQFKDGGWNILKSIGERMHEYGGFSDSGDDGYRGTAYTAPETAETDMLREADRLASEQMRLADMRNMAFAYMSANEAMRQTMDQAQNTNSNITIDNTMFF